MELSDWLTVAVSLVVGLGSAGLTIFYAGRTAALDRRAIDSRLADERTTAKRIALSNYQRVLEDLTVDMEESMMGNFETWINENYEKFIEKSRSEAYVYFDSFPEDERRLLKWPVHRGPYQVEGLERMEARARLANAADAIEKYLTSSETAFARTRD